MTTVLVGTRDGFHLLGSDQPRMPAGYRMTAVQRVGGGLWAISDGDTLWHHPDGGEGEPVARSDSESLECLLVANGDVLAGGSRATLFRFEDGELTRVEGFDEVPGRDRWYTPWGGPPDVQSMAAGPEGTIYVNVHVGGVVRSTDGGGTWTDTMDIDADVHQVVADPNRPCHAYAAAAVGLGVTSDGAGTWRFDTAGLHATYCRAVALSDEMVFLSASTGSGGRHAALYRRPIESDAGFERCTAGLPEWFSTNVDTACVAAAGPLVAVGDADGTVYVSDDHGANWEVAAKGLPGVTCLAAW